MTQIYIIKSNGTAQIVTPSGGWTINDSGVSTLSGAQPLNANLTSWAAITRAAGMDTFTATPSSANFASLITDETGTGSVVLSISPTFTTPILGTPTSGTLTNCTGYTTANLSGTITNAQLAGSIAYSKLSLTGAILNSDLAGSIDLTAKVTGALPQANIAALTGDVTKPSGSGVTTLANIPAIAGTNLTGTAANLTAGKATALATARNINGVAFDGSAAITVPPPLGLVMPVAHGLFSS